MSATAVEKITPQPFEPRDTTRRTLSATRKAFFEVGDGVYL